MYGKFFNNFFNQNKNIIILNTVLAITIYPLELLLLSYLSGSIFFSIKNKDIKQFIKVFLIFTFVYILISVLFWFSEKLDARILPKLQTSIRKDIMNRLFQNNIQTTSFQSGELIQKLNNIPNFVYLNYVNIITYICPFVFSIIFFTLFMFFIHYSLGICCVIFFVIFLLCFLLRVRKTIHVVKNRYQLDNTLMNSFEDVIRNNTTVSLHNQKIYETILFYQQNQEYQQNLSKEMNHIYDMKISFITFLIFFFILLTIGACYLHYKQKLALFKLIIYVSAIMLMIKSFHNLIRRTADSVSYIGPLLHQDDLKFFDSTILHNGTKQKGLTHFDIRLENATYITPQQQTLFKDVNLSIPHGIKVVITGQIGSGKSTLLNILIGYNKLSSGTLYYDELSIDDINLNYLRSHVTYMNQQVCLFRRSVLENIFYGEIKDSESWIQKWSQLQQLPIFPKIQSFILNENTEQLSGGQKQIVLLLRCYFKYPKILYLDEPTANVDSKTRDIILEVLSLLRQSTIVCITHDQSILSFFDVHYQLTNYTFERVVDDDQ